MSKDAERVWDLMEKISICMLANWDGVELRSRPMGAFVRRKNNAVYFLTDARHHKDDDIKKYPQVCLAFADPGSQKFVSLSGHAEVSADRTAIKELWSTPAKAWWDSPDDPNIRVLKVVPDDAQFWEGPGKVVSTVKMAVAAMTGNRPDLGDNRKVAM
ncbi:pyridoxamine 5'-phosphate oxidase family protein [Pseudorhodoplanes sinuspersici]|uniref:General stress protein n=1 Tax=Pseudorhodoplanes sinuspersici TaxID=1235591 RepID=A0A1W6ZNP0_9HYPH|nr:pyridoxamine 5'-phosphate oxidase family protein [Pseudorhodoplanes sinuspersici]ARP99018.1 general stress protein [Pseudorhodoplanes sinuspersici]RKE69340.1 general stress protein 26 [Pseudorhodoplanes sinuspersici]